MLSYLTDLLIVINSFAQQRSRCQRNFLRRVFFPYIEMEIPRRRGQDYFAGESQMNVSHEATAVKLHSNYYGLFLRTSKFRLLLIAFSVLSSGLVLAQDWTYGVALFWDSIYYISVARHLLQGEGFVTLFGHPYTSWPPLYPSLLAAASCFIFDPHDVAGPVNAVIFGLTVFVTGRYLRERLESDILALWGCFAVMLSIPLAWMAAWALSEPLFILLATLSLVQVDIFLNTQKRSAIIWAAIFTAMACLTRYMGVTLIFTISLLIVLQRNRTMTEKLQRLIEYSFISIIPVGLWMLNNATLSGSLTGERRFGEYRLLDTTIEILSGLLVETSLYSDVRYGSVVISLAILFFLIIVTSCKMMNLRFAARLPSFSTFSIFIFSYLFLLVFFAIRYTPDGIQTRFLSPVYVPCIITIAFLTKWLIGYNIRGSVILRFLRFCVISTFSFWLVYSSFLTINQIYHANTHGIGIFNNSEWSNSEILRYVDTNSLPGHVISNEPLPLYLHNHTNATYRYLRPGRLNDWIEDPEEDSYLVWFYPGPYVGDFGYFTADLVDLPGLNPIAILADGIIFTFGEKNTMNNTINLPKWYESTISQEPIIRSVFDLYFDKNTLKFIYVKEPCNRADIELPFFLHTIPVDLDELPSNRKQYGFENLDFDFAQRGMVFDGKCMSFTRSPAYAVASIRTGQFIPGAGPVWGEEIQLDTANRSP